MNKISFTLPCVLFTMLILTSISQAQRFDPREDLLKALAAELDDQREDERRAEDKGKAKDPFSRYSEEEDPFNIIYRIEVGEGLRTGHLSVEPLPADALMDRPRSDKTIEGTETPPVKIHPLLTEWLAKRPRDEQKLLVITFKDDLQLPRFPELKDESRDSKANREVLHRIKHLVEAIEKVRSEDYKRIRDELRRQFKAKVLETYWLIKGAVIEMPLRSVPALARWDEVAYIEPIHNNVFPMGHDTPFNDVQAGRALLKSDVYVSILALAGFGNNFNHIGLLDSGVRFTHDVFNFPDPIAIEADCFEGDGTLCAVFAGHPEEQFPCDHGTLTAAVMVGNKNLGNAYRGVTTYTLDSWKVIRPVPGLIAPIPPHGKCAATTEAIIRGFQSAVFAANKVIVAPLGSRDPYYSAMSTAANKAFDTGAVVVAANGNVVVPGPETVSAPANAAKVLGVGAFNMLSGLTPFYQSQGPALVAFGVDWRFKPDIQAPTDTETAHPASDSALGLYGGTSAATAYAGGAAQLLRHWLKVVMEQNDPGSTYAQMILSGQQPNPTQPNVTGAGHLKLPTQGLFFNGKVSVPENMMVEVPIDLSNLAPNTFKVDAALWWPISGEQGSIKQLHRDIDLRLYDSSQPVAFLRAKSDSLGSVWERARAAADILPAGTWKLQILGHDCVPFDSCQVPTAPQTVYFSVVASPKE